VMRRSALAAALRAASSPAVANVRTFSTTPVAKAGENVPVFVRGVRTPFCLSGTDYEDYMAYDLQREAIKGLLKKTAIDPKEIDYVCTATVIQEVLTSNVAREASLSAGIPNSVPGHTVTLACIGSNVATATGVDKIKTGQAEVFLAGGVETMSDVPIRFSRPIRKRLIRSTKMKTPAQYLSLLSGLKGADFAPQAPGVAEFATGEIMGHSADRLCAAFGVSREDQDAFARRSHQNAADAAAAGLFKDEIVPVKHSVKDHFVTADNGIRPSTPEQLAKLKPAFIKPHGTVTAANASFLTDGASASLIMSEAKCAQLGMKPRSYIRDYVFVSQDPVDQLLLGPTYATAKLLKKTGLSMADIGVWEFHEAFAGQVLANLEAMDNDAWCNKWLGHGKIGRIPMELLNTRGGSLSVGHPFGATGTRLLTWASERLRDDDKQLAVVTACAAGGQGVAMLVERHPDY
jgi:acetyl-CoA acyltransferase